MRRIPIWFIIPFILALGGCASAPTSKTQRVPVAAGRMIEVEYGPRGVLPGRANGFEVIQADLLPGTDVKEAVYHFAFTSPPDTTLQSVRVDDISEELDKADPMVDDQHPWQTDNRWHGESKPIPATDPRLAWVLQVVPTMRVYRFVIVDSTNRKSVLYQAVPYPEMFKAAIRHKWGEKY